MFVVAIFGNPWDTQFLDNSIAVVSGFRWLLASSIWRSPLFLFPSCSAREPSESRQFHFLNYPSNQRVLTREFLKIAIDAQFRKISRRTATYFWFSPTVLSRKHWNSSRAFTRHLLHLQFHPSFSFASNCILLLAVSSNSTLRTLRDLWMFAIRIKFLPRQFHQFLPVTRVSLGEAFRRISLFHFNVRHFTILAILVIPTIPTKFQGFAFPSLSRDSKFKPRF